MIAGVLGDPFEAPHAIRKRDSQRKANRSCACAIHIG